MSDTNLFVVRVWRQLASGFRASVRRVDNEQTNVFSQPDELARFLCAPAPASGDSDAPAQPAPPRAIGARDDA